MRSWLCFGVETFSFIWLWLWGVQLGPLSGLRRKLHPITETVSNRAINGLIGFVSPVLTKQAPIDYFGKVEVERALTARSVPSLVFDPCPQGCGRLNKKTVTVDGHLNGHPTASPDLHPSSNSPLRLLHTYVGALPRRVRCKLVLLTFTFAH